MENQAVKIGLYIYIDIYDAENFLYNILQDLMKLSTEKVSRIPT